MAVDDRGHVHARVCFGNEAQKTRCIVFVQVDGLCLCLPVGWSCGLQYWLAVLLKITVSLR
jgi:hypothetical protein